MNQLTKEEWEHWREMPNIPIDVWFSFYKEKGGYLEDVQQFTQIFLTLVNNQSTVMGSNGIMKEITPQGAFGKMKEYYDKKFGIYVQPETLSGTSSRSWGEFTEEK